MFYSHERNFGCRITEYLLKGLRSVTLENEIVRVSILVDKGTDIFEFLHKPTDTDFMWRSPLGIRNPSLFVPSIPRPEGAFMDFYEGGWQEIMPSGGGPSIYKGAHLGVHGEVSLIPWEYKILEDAPEKVKVKFWVRTYRTPFYLEKTITLVRNTGILILEEKVVNEGMEDMDLMWGHHPAFGPPFLDDSCILDIPPAKVITRELGPNSRLVNGEGFNWPKVIGKDGNEIDLSVIPPPESRSNDSAVISDLSEGWYALTNTKKKVGFGMVWPKDVFPYIWCWFGTGGGFGQPFYGRAYTVAIEPWTSYPNNLSKALEAGTTKKLLPSEELKAKIMAVVYDGVENVLKLTAKGEVLSNV